MGELYYSERVDFKVREVIRDKEGQDMMIKGSIIQEDIKFLMCMHLTTEHLKYVRQKLIALKGEIDESTITDRVLSTPLSDTDKSSRQKSVRTQVNLTTPFINLYK